MGEALQKKPSQEGRFLFNCHDRRMKAYLDRRWNTWGPPGWRREYEERAGVMEEKRTPPELARAMMELLGCPCTYFAPMWDDDPLLECLQDVYKRQVAHPCFRPEREYLLLILLPIYRYQIGCIPIRRTGNFRRQCFVPCGPSGEMCIRDRYQVNHAQAHPR